MAKDNFNVSVGRKGMNRDVHPMNLAETEYSIAFNANYEDESGNGYPMLQNEHSNILCSRFKEGFKVIGFKHDLNEDRTFYFLTNPDTGNSEIGYISNIQNITSVEDVEVQCGCNVKRILDTPLEDQEQEPTCEYITVISDNCNNCLNFSINHPIREGNIQIKDEKCGKRLYWTDNYNPPRYLDLDNLEQYGYVGIQTCKEDTLEETCLDCDKLRIFPFFEKPCIAPVSIQYGGNLKAGVYEFLVAYCDKAGNEITQYYSITNPISIFDENRNILDQTELDYRTNFGIRLEVSDLDDKFGYYKVAVIQRADVNSATSYFIEGVHPTTDKTVLYYSEDDKARTTLNHLLAVKPTYTKAGIMTSSNGYLFQADLTAEKEYNLQPVINLMGAFLRWQTVKAHENLYKDGVNNSLYRGYMRDEVYPFSIRFYTNDGYETANSILVNRPPDSTDLQVVNNKDTQSVNQFSPNCAETGRIYRWQYYNTASVLQTDCTGSGNVPDVDLECEPAPFEVGKFGYWQSVEEYPDNEDLYNSQNLVINPNDVPNSIKSEFEEYFTNGQANGQYILKDNTDLRCQPIRHYKFPDYCISPFMSETSEGIFQDSYIYPIGVTIDEEVVNFFLDVAWKNGLITEEQRNKLDKFEIFRGDRTLHKGVIAKGLAYDMYKYNESESESDVLYPNYPYNDLGEDDLHYTNKDRNGLIQHPFGGTSNNRYTFHSPDTHFHKPSLPSEIKVEAYQFGNSRGQFVQVDGHSKWVILSSEAYAIATTLAVTEAAFELAIKYGDFQVQNAIAGDRIVKTAYGGQVRKASKVKSTVKLTESFNAGISGDLGWSVTGYTTGGTAAGGSTGQITSNTQDNETTGNPDDNFTEGDPTENYDDYGTIQEVPNPDGEEGDVEDVEFISNHDGNNDGHHSASFDENQDELSLVEKILVWGGMIESTFSKIGQYRYEWLKIFKDNGQPENFAFYYTSEGWYNYMQCNPTEGEMIRGLSAKRYLKPGRFRVNETNATDALKINNVNRESSVFLSFGEGHNINYPNTYSGFDNSRFESSDVGVGGGVDIDLGLTDDDGNPLYNFTYDARSPEVTANIASPYVALRNYLPSQYGEVESIKWIPTGFCGQLGEGNTCPRIFGGDIFISRFSLKRKIPLFLTTAIDLADLTPFNYYPYRNIGHPRYYCDYDVTEMNVLGDLGNDLLNFLASIFTLGIIGQPMPQFKSYYDFDNESENGFYVRPPSKFYLYYYGIPQFLVESEINCNYRYARKELHENFYPNVGDYVEWTQEKTVSIRNDNHYYYNDTYSKNTTMVGTRMLPSTYDKDLYNCLYDAPNGVIYSLQDTSEQDITDPWLIYRPLDFYQFPTSAGRLIDLKDIESAQILGRFENQVILFNAIDQLRERLTPQNQELGTGGIFASRPLEFKRTDLGYAGTQHKDMVSCEFGHFWADAKRGQVFQVDQNGKNLREITPGLRNWFKEHLPFKILKAGIDGLTYEELDNSFKGLGLTMGWDSRYKRVFLTKKDYVVKKDYIGRITYTDGEFYIDKRTLTSLTNREVFQDASYTLAYNPIAQSWISYYSFKPNYYVSYHNYFQTGVNYSSDSSEEGLWSHLLTNKSYQVFYGKRYGWLIEVPVKENYVNKILKSVEYWLDTRRYHNEYDFAENRRLGFNKAWIYNHSNNSGLLNLVTEEKNNRHQKLQYPITRPNSQDILATEDDKKWTFNYFFNQVKDELNNNPIWYYDVNQIDKVINMSAIHYNQRWKDRLRGDWFLLRLGQDNESRFKQIFKWVNSKESIYS